VGVQPPQKTIFFSTPAIKSTCNEKMSTEMAAAGTNRGYKVVGNHDKQYSIRPADGKNPRWWKIVGILGSRLDCFAFYRESIDRRAIT
jgi:uncharacterized protein YbdZ (MbtH family)